MALDDSPELAPVRDEAPSGMGWFNAGVGSWFGAFGMQGVLFSWLVVGELHTSAEWVGVAQTSTSLPQLILLLLGGVTADRLDVRRVITLLHLVAAAPALALALAVATDHLTLTGVICYGVAMGATSAFMMPARDTLLSQVAGASMIRAVSGMTTVQFTAQALGALLAGSAQWLGSSSMLMVQSAVLASGSWFGSRLPARRARHTEVDATRVRGPDERGMHELTAGLREVFRSPILRPTAVLVISVGLFFIGPFLVIFPLLVRDHYQGGVDQLAIVLMLFPMGTILGSVLLRLRGGLEGRFRATALALGTAGALLAAMGTGTPFEVFMVLTLLWGLAGSVFINASRTIFQEEASPSHRARVLSVYQLGLMGAAPIGSLSAGFASAALGPLLALVAAGAAMIALVAIVWWSTPRRVRAR